MIPRRRRPVTSPAAAAKADESEWPPRIAGPVAGSYDRDAQAATPGDRPITGATPRVEVSAGFHPEGV